MKKKKKKKKEDPKGTENLAVHVVVESQPKKNFFFGLSRVFCSVDGIFRVYII